MRVRGPSSLAATLGLAALALAAQVGCWPAFLVLSKVEDAVEDAKDRRLPPYLCGNAICDRGRGESCRSCPADCGACDKGPAELVVLSPETGRAARWVSVFGTHLERVTKLWLAPGPGRPLVVLKHRRVGPRLEVFIPAGSTGGTLHVEAGHGRRVTKLSYAVRH